ncbi:hypothetical protein O0I10_003142 [Lichtheimia ornata]|uniref:PDEase domain-containing protein n=1 Tax=Lichtheimia ornata TaxID=688661 RepID=A0AAD7Y024_9FUNG|nr:uncharacterized protein O0I10_003142 [Lichtheimia ornata]KAJ8660920.1 hypothetical protein O0I10_003142 [Lichtheimia ornata]
MIILKHNTLSANDLFSIERRLIRWLDCKGQPIVDSDFNVLDLQRTDLYGHLLGIFAKLDVFNTLDISPSQMLDFLIDVDATYLDAPYHSFYHAVDIVTVLYYILTELEAEQYLSRLDVAALLLAALCHDAGHPGYTNLFQVNIKTQLADRYNNTSVLESYSVDIARSLLHKHKLLKSLSTGQNINVEDDADSFIGTIENLILSTDMVYHYELQQQAGKLEECLTDHYMDEDDFDDFWSMSSDSEESLCTPTTTSSECTTSTSNNNHHHHHAVLLSCKQRLSLCRILLHAADISNTVRPWPISKQWSDLIVQEFFRQGDAEKVAGLPVSPGMDRDHSTQPDISLKFGDYVVKPYFEALTGFLPMARSFLVTLADNKNEWERLKDRPEAAMPPLSCLAHERQFPTSLLPPEPVLNPSGRRVSVAAGMVVIPDDQNVSIRQRQRSTMLLRRPPLTTIREHHHYYQLIHGDFYADYRRPSAATITTTPSNATNCSTTLHHHYWPSPLLLKPVSFEPLYHPQDRFTAPLVP